jgi:two-component system, NtrC family, sensor kinase
VRTVTGELALSATRQIPWHQRLSTQLLGVTVLIVLTALGAFALFGRAMQEALLAQAVSGGLLFSETIRNATERAMLEDRRADAYEIMRAIAIPPDIDRIRLVNKSGVITFSSRPEEVGQRMETSRNACLPCHAAGRPLARLPPAQRSRIIQLGDHRALGLITPTYNEPRCATSECHQHAGGEQVLGIFDVVVSLKEADARMARLRWGSLYLTMLGALLLGGFFLYAVRRRVIRPVAAQDELEQEITVTAPGELQVLADGFNEMTRALRRVEGDLKALNLDLERKVAERTADLTRAQAALVQSEKLSSLGQLSASIAHEINNPLAGILTFAKLITREIETAVPDQAKRTVLVRNLALVQRESERCSAIVRNLLDFARERPLALKDVDLNAAVRESVQLVGHQLAMQGHRLEARLVDLPPVHADFGELRQAVVNLIMNAMEAMGRDGLLEVETRPVDGGRAVELSVRDSGPGIAPEHLQKIFDPFFTTKEKGTGLGLSVVYGIIQRHGGTLSVQSEPGQGTCFTVHLPRAEPAPGA